MIHLNRSPVSLKDRMPEGDCRFPSEKSQPTRSASPLTMRLGLCELLLRTFGLHIKI